MIVCIAEKPSVARDIARIIGATQSIVQAVIARDTPPTEMGKANSMFFMSMDLGSGVGPVLIGAVIPFIGYSASYLVLAAIAAFAAALYHHVHGKTHGRAASSEPR